MRTRDTTNIPDSQELVYKPLTLERWGDFVRLFSEPGVQHGCWCMYWRVKRSEFHRCYGDKNKRTMKKIITSGRIPGIIAYHKQDPVGWCSIAPRDDFPVLDRSPTLKRIDARSVWSIVCLFITRAQRGKGLTHALIQAAIKHAERNGARIIEAYPIFSAESNYAKWELYTGLVSTFDKLGFKIAARRSKVRPIMRLCISGVRGQVLQ